MLLEMRSLQGRMNFSCQMGHTPDEMFQKSLCWPWGECCVLEAAWIFAQCSELCKHESTFICVCALGLLLSEQSMYLMCLGIFALGRTDGKQPVLLCSEEGGDATEEKSEVEVLGCAADWLCDSEQAELTGTALGFLLTELRICIELGWAGPGPLGFGAVVNTRGIPVVVAVPCLDLMAEAMEPAEV